MALFGKKKKAAPVQDHDDDELDEFAVVDEDDDIFSSASPAPNYDDDIGDFDDEFDDEEGDSDKDEKASPIVKMIVVGISALLLAGAGFYIYKTSDVSLPGSEEKQEQQEGEGVNKDQGEGVVVDEKVGKEYVGSDNGNTKNGTGAIMAFTYDYYTTRSGEKAREHFNPLASSYDGQYIQNEIDQVPEGTTYELKVTPRTIGKFYDGTITLSLPNAKTYSFDIDYEVMEKDGVFYVKTFEEDTSSKEQK